MMAIPCEMLLHPELLTNDQLMYIIQERHLHIPNIEILGRDGLLELFHQFCVPYGQRKYRDSGRGKILNKVRQSSPEPSIKLNTISIQYTKTHHEHFERLKPPPDILSSHTKRIKLDTKPNVIINDVNKIKRKIPVETVHMATETPPRKKERKLITWP